MSMMIEIILAVITLLSGCGWFISGRKYRQEVESIRADNRQKALDLSTEFAEKFRELIGQPLETEVIKLRNQIKELRDAIETIYDCAHSSNCPVRKRLQRSTKGEQSDRYHPSA